MDRKSAPAISYHMPKDEVIGLLGANTESGLTGREAARRRPGRNRIYDESRTSILRYVGYCSFDLLLILLLLTAVTASAFGDGAENAIVIPILAVSIVLRTVAYIVARRYLEACSAAPEVMPGVTVMRDGGYISADARELVRGDMIKMRVGDIVPADCRLITSSGLVVFEEQASGVPGAVRKDAELMSRANTVYAGSSVVSGECTAVVIYTGADTLLVRTRGYFKPQRGKMKLSRLLDIYSRKWGALMAALAFAVTVLDLFIGGRGIYEVFFLGLSLATAATCEYYSAIGDITAALGAYALAKKTGAAVRGVRSVEASAEIDTLIVPADGVVVKDGIECHAVYFGGDVTEFGENGEDTAVPDELLSWAASVTGAEEFAYSGASLALNEYISYIGSGVRTPEGMTPLFIMGPSDGLAFDTRLFALTDGYMSVSCGDAAAIVDLCAFLCRGDEKFALSDELRAGIAGFITHHERRGAVAVAISRKRTPFSSRERMAFTQTDMELYGIVILYKPLADGAAKVVAACREAGIRVIMTGADTSAARLADRAGIISGRDDIITGRQFTAMQQPERHETAARARLLLGFDDDATAAYMSELRATGAKTAYVAVRTRSMRGELRALGDAEAGFAIYGDGAAEVAADTLRMHADTVVPRAEDGGGLAAVTETLAYARRIYRNISNIADYMLTSQAARIFAVLFTVISKNSAINAPGLLLWGLIFDFFAILVLASERTDENSLSDRADVYGRLSHPLSKLGKTSAFGLLWAVLTVLMPRLYPGEAGMGASIVFVSALLSAVVVCGEHRSSYPAFSYKRQRRAGPVLMAAAVAVAVILITVFPPAAEAMRLMPPDAWALGLSVVPAIGLLIAYEAERLIRRGR